MIILKKIVRMNIQYTTQKGESDVIAQTKKKHIQNRVIHFGVIGILGLLYLFIVIRYEEPTYLHLLLLMSIFIWFLSLIIFTHKINRKLIDKRIRIKDTNYKIPYPQKFKDYMLELGQVMGGYRYKNYIIPEFFIEFREGHRLYLYHMIEDITDETYTIVRIHKDDLALVKDSKDKKYIVHLGNTTCVD